LALSHPVCGYASVRLEITVPLDIERLQLGQEVTLNGGVRLYIENTSSSLNRADEAFHNMYALNLATSPVLIQRTDFNIWSLRVESTDRYLNYGEFYFGYWRNRPGDNKISMLVDGSFRFDTTWTRQ